MGKTVNLDAVSLEAVRRKVWKVLNINIDRSFRSASQAVIAIESLYINIVWPL